MHIANLVIYGSIERVKFMAGKGSKPRPVKKKLFDANFDEISKNPDADKDFKWVRVRGKLVQRKVFK